MIRDFENDGKKCDQPGSAHRLFNYRDDSAQEIKCRDQCALNDRCVSVSGIWNVWCTGCDAELNVRHYGAKAFRKAKQRNKSIQNHQY